MKNTKVIEITKCADCPRKHECKIATLRGDIPEGCGLPKPERYVGESMRRTSIKMQARMTGKSEADVAYELEHQSRSYRQPGSGRA